MTEQPQQPQQPQGGPDPTQMSEEQLRAQIAEEMKRIQVPDVLLQTVVTLINLGGQRLGLSPDTEDVRDLAQARLAIDGARALVPVLEQVAPGELGPIRDAISQVQMAYAQQAGGEAEATQAPSGQADSPPAQADSPAQPQQEREGGLWVPPGSQT